MDQTSPDAPIHAHHHAVQFYGNDSSLVATVGGFLSEGLIGGQPAIIIATETHREAIVEELSRRLIDVQHAQETGTLVLLDAEETLALFMTDDAPDAELFTTHVGGLISRTLGERPRAVVRAYGEMVDVLWRAGRTESAIRLEILWNKLATTHGFALLCGYAMGNFYKQAEKYAEICGQHTHVTHAESNVVAFEPKRAIKTA